MKDKYLHPVRNGIIATVVGGVILSALPRLRGFLLDAASWTWEGVIWIWVTLISYYSMPGWAFLVVGFLALVGLMAIYAHFQPENEPKYKTYTEDRLHGVIWRWSWVGGRISNLWCFCPSCDAQLIYSYNSSSQKKINLICEHCTPNESDRHRWGQGRVLGKIIVSVDGDQIEYVKDRVVKRDFTADQS